MAHRTKGIANGNFHYNYPAGNEMSEDSVHRRVDDVEAERLKCAGLVMESFEGKGHQARQDRERV